MCSSDLLRTHGLSDSEILDVAAAASARCFFSKLLDALGVQADAAYHELDPALSAVLTVGRPVASSGKAGGADFFPQRGRYRRPDGFKVRPRWSVPLPGEFADDRGRDQAIDSAQAADDAPHAHEVWSGQPGS